MNSIYKADMSRNIPRTSHVVRFLFFLRLASATRLKSVNILCRLALLHYQSRYGLEIPWSASIGPGFYIGHGYCITINPKAKIGKNCNVHRGVLIGQTNRGMKAGVPTIGDEVWIGINATLVGNITIGNDVMIAPGSFVNCDVPSHSVVLGNPCIVKPKEHATEGYINHKIG